VSDARHAPGRALRLYALAAYTYLYGPILVLVLFSFNQSKFGVRWTGFTLDWYRALAADRFIRDATWNTLVVAAAATALATVIGTAAAVGLHRYRFRGRRLTEAALYVPVVVPEVVMGIAMLAAFAQAFAVLDAWTPLDLRLGLGTIIVAHTAFAAPFVTLTVRARLHGFDRRLEEAAMDLGADEWATFRRVTLPLILPGVVAGALLAFTLSLDDYIVTLFVAGPGSTTLPLRVYAMLRQAVTPKINALSTIWLLLVFGTLLAAQWFGRRGGVSGRYPGVITKGGGS